MKRYVCALSDVAPGHLKAATVEGQQLCVARVAEGDVYVVSDTCSHEDSSLSEGEIVECEVECSAHLARFDLRSGAAMCEPADRPIQTFVVTVENDEIYVDLD